LYSNYFTHYCCCHKNITIKNETNIEETNINSQNQRSKSQNSSSQNLDTYFSTIRLAKQSSINTLNDYFDEKDFKTKILYFFVQNNVSFRTIASKIFRELLLYCRRFLASKFYYINQN